MTGVRMTPAAARALGIDVPAARAKTTRKAAPARDCSPTRCCTCDATFDTIAAEDRHHRDTRHGRYEAVLEVLR